MLTEETIDHLKKLIRAHLSLSQAQEYVRIRLRDQMQTDQWSIEEVYSLIDKDNKGWINVYDIEKLLSTHTKIGN